MAQPIISWYNATHTEEVTAPFDFKIIDAGDSPLFTPSIFGTIKAKPRMCPKWKIARSLLAICPAVLAIR